MAETIQRLGGELPDVSEMPEIGRCELEQKQSDNN
jgi:hypothetical protein